MPTEQFPQNSIFPSASLVLDAPDIIGETIVYDDRRNALLGVDIDGKRIHRLALGERRHEIWPTPELPTSIGLRKDGGAIVGLTTRVALWNYDNVFETSAVPEPDVPDNRLNEARVGPDGSFWVGTMQNNLNPDGSNREVTRNSGAVYRIKPDGSVQQLTPGEYGSASRLNLLSLPRIKSSKRGRVIPRRVTASAWVMPQLSTTFSMELIKSDRKVRFKASSGVSVEAS